MLTKQQPQEAVAQWRKAIEANPKARTALDLLVEMESQGERR